MRERNTDGNYANVSREQLLALQQHLLYDNMRKEQVIERLHVKVRTLIAKIKQLEKPVNIQHVRITARPLGRNWKLKVTGQERNLQNV